MKRWLTNVGSGHSLALVALILAIGAVAGVVNPRFLSVINVINIFQQIAVLGIVASGVGMLLVAGEVDISTGNQVSLIGVVFAMLVQGLAGLPDDNPALPALAPYAIPIAVAAAFVLGGLLGLLNGTVVVRTRAPSFIVTLGFSTIYTAAALMVTSGASFMLYGRFQTLGRGKVLGFLPVSILFFLGAMGLAFGLLKYTRYGRFLYAIGGNRKAAYVSGIATRKYTLIAFVALGLLDALAAIILISRVGSALANTGDSLSLDALASVIVGGIALTGGTGSAASIFLGVVLIGIIGNALIIMNVNPFMRGAVIGLVTIAAVTGGRFSSDRD